MIHLLLACTDATGDSATPEDVLDLRLTEDDLPAEAGNQETWWGADTIIEPGQDVMWCTIGTYEGPDAGIHENISYQAEFGHHFVLMGTAASEIDYPDGTTFDCTNSDSYMIDLEPMALVTSGYVDGELLGTTLPMPEGMAVELDQGQRYILQSHYLNTSTERIRVQDGIQLTLLDPDTEVDTWAAPYAMSLGEFSLPPQETTEITFDCTAEADWSVLYMIPHMHEWGTVFRLDQDRAGDVSNVLDIPTWEPYFRDAPPVEVYGDTPMHIQAGDVLSTSCTWFNDTDEAIAFPHEMCVSVGVVYPQTTPVICDAVAR